MIVGFHPLANQELTDAAQFYEARAPGLGARFLDAVERSLALLSTHPELGRPGPGPFRAFPIRRFPYSLVYRFDPDRLEVLALAHHRRHPQYWSGRIG
jgi:plasmid stabilization system protein ParE